MAGVRLDVSGIRGFRCKAGCSECCGPVPWSPWEVGALMRFLHRAGRRLPAVPEGLDCPFLELGACSVYPVRPYMCRLFGVAEGLECPRGCRPERLVSAVEAGRLVRGYAAGMGAAGPVFFVGGGGRLLLDVMGAVGMLGGFPVG